MSDRPRRGWVVPLLLAGAVFAGMQLWRDHQQRALGERMAAAAGPGDIVMLSSDHCVYCEAARRWFVAHRVRFDECFIERDAACAESYRTQGAPGTPTLLVRGERQVGFDAQRVALALEGR